jgi:chromosome partitioning protein
MVAANTNDCGPLSLHGMRATMISKPPTGTRVLALLSQKGGSGKTTLATHLAVAFGRDRRVVLVDTDPQRSAAAWWRAREAATPELIEAEAESITGTLRTIRAGGAGLVVIDSMPSVKSEIGSIARAADFVLIPCRPSILDLRAVGGTVELVKAGRVAAAIVLNAVPAARGIGEASVTVEARKALAQYGLPVLSVAIGQRAVLAHALAAGLAVEEYEPASRAAGEIRNLARMMEEHLWRNVPTSAPSI